MYIIGHRGAASLALENTIESFTLAHDIGVDAIELDVRKTKDGKLVVCHDADLLRIANNPTKVSDVSLKELQKIVLVDGHSTIPTLEEAFKHIKTSAVMIELKASGCGRGLVKLLKKFQSNNVVVMSFDHNELSIFRKLSPTTPLYGLEQTRPFEIIDEISIRKFNGIGLNFWLLNPWTYFRARRRRLDLFVYTVNSRFLVNLIRFCYPGVKICTDYPQRFVKTIKRRRNRKFKRYNSLSDT
jgi:glycerophosphoryl diester phosphodiesterase